jgi:hypothetical protein
MAKPPAAPNPNAEVVTYLNDDFGNYAG